MNQFFEALGRRWSDAASKRGMKIREPELSGPVADELLELARVVAHGKERRFAPLATYTAGVAAERMRADGADEARIAAMIREVREALEKESPPANG